MKNKRMDLWHVIRILTTAPLMAIDAILCLWFLRKDSFTGTGQLIYDIALLGVLPLAAYPTQKCFPRFRSEGRQGQRYLAMIYAVAGYLLCLLFHAIDGASSGQWMLCLEYLCSGLVILLVNKVFHRKISGHACGVMGPALILAYHEIPWAIPVGLLILVIVNIASLKTKRHTLSQLIGGSIAPLIVYGILSQVL